MSDVQSRVSLGFGSSGASSVRADIASIYAELRRGEKTIKQANEDLRTHTAQINAQSRAIMAMGKSYKDQYIVWFEASRAMRNVGSIGRSLLSVYQTHTLQQMRLGDATRDITELEKELGRVQELRAIATHDLGAESVYVLALMADEAQLVAQITQARQNLANAQNENLVMYSSMAMTLTGTVSNLAYMSQHLSTLNLLLSDSTIRATTLAAAYGALAGAINTAAAALILYGFYHAVTGDPKQIAQETYGNLLGTSGYGTANIGAGWGFTPELLESDLPGTSALRDLYLGDNPMPEGLIRDYIIADIQQPSGYEKGREHREERVTLNQTVNIRSADDKTTVNKIVDATVKAVGEATRR